jgi:uncharacterized protein YprB with RNaseH-like and TPR domain
LPRDIRRKLSQLGRPKEAEQAPAEPEERSRPAPEERPTERAPAAPSRREAKDDTLGRVSRRLLRDRLQERFLGEQPEEPSPSFGPARALEEVLPGEEVENELGPVYVARIRAVEAGAGPELEERLRDALRRDDLAAGHTEFALLAGADPAKVMFLDTETTGLTGVPLFLCGTMSRGDDGLAIEQVLARDYTEEPALLRHVQSGLEATDVLVTYNGRTFDLPYIHDRMAYHLLDYRYGGEHMDLLPHARRLYREVFPDCKLQTLETHLCGLPVRTGDIPGADIPQAYHDFVATANAGILAPIFRHNAQDLIVLCDVMLRMIEEYGR